MSRKLPEQNPKAGTAWPSHWRVTCTSQPIWDGLCVFLGPSLTWLGAGNRGQGESGGQGGGLSPEGNGKPWTGLCYTRVRGGCYEEGLGRDGSLGGRTCPEPGLGVGEVGRRLGFRWRHAQPGTGLRERTSSLLSRFSHRTPPGILPATACVGASSPHPSCPHPTEPSGQCH